jgi:hypothetical protein
MFVIVLFKKLSAMKSSRAINCANIEFVSDVSETVSSSIISGSYFKRYIKNYLLFSNTTISNKSYENTANF